MGTHPIFESDFDCLTGLETGHGKEGEKRGQEERGRQREG